MSIFKRPKAPAKTAEQAAGEIRTRSLLDKEIEEEEERLRLARRGKLGRSSLLSGAPRTVSESAGSGIRGAGGGVGSLLTGPGTAPRETRPGSPNSRRTRN